MTVDDELLLERFVRDLSTLSDSEQERVHDLLQSDPDAIEFIEFFRRYYDGVECVGDPPSKRIRDLLDGLNDLE